MHAVGEREDRIRALKQELNELTRPRSDQDERCTPAAKDPDVDRRSFIKKAAAGAAGLSAAALLSQSASAYQIRSTNPFTISDIAGNTNFEVDTEGTLFTNQIGSNATPVTDAYIDTITLEQGTISQEPSAADEIATRQYVDDTAMDGIGDTANVENFSITGWSHIDAVEKGADPTGGTDITPVLESIRDEYGDNTLILLPEGTYRMDSGFSWNNATNVGILGQGATVQPNDSSFNGVGTNESLNVFSLGSSGSIRSSNVYFGGIDFDFTDHTEDGDPGVSAFIAYFEDRAIVEDITITGKPDHSSRMIELHVSSGVDTPCFGRISRVQMPDGTPSAGIWVGGTDETQFLIEDCYVANCDDNGFYMSTGSHTVTIERCVARNNDIANIRLARGTARECAVFVDDSSQSNARGYRLRPDEDSNVRLENCRAHYSVEGTRGPVEINTGVQAAVIDQCEFEVNGSPRFMYIYGEGDIGDENTGQIVIRNTVFHGARNDNASSEGIRVDRGGTVFENCRYESTEENVHGLRIQEGATNCRIIGGYWHMGERIWLSDGGNHVIRDATVVSDYAPSPIRVSVPDVTVENVTMTPDSIWLSGYTGTEPDRFVRNGLGTNDGDPNVEGEWNGEGRPGVMVEDTNTGDIYLYAGDADTWIRIHEN